MRALLLIAYPILAHAAVVTRSPWLEWTALSSLAAGCCYEGLLARRATVWASFAGILALLAALTAFGGGRYALYLPSLAAPLLALIPFAGSLRPGHTPLITRIAEQVHRPLPPELVGYTRGVTWLWTLTILVFSGIDLSLMLFADRTTWSLYANGWAYLILAAVFFGEYGWRLWRFRHLHHPAFADYLRLVMRNPPHTA